MKHDLKRANRQANKRRKEKKRKKKEEKKKKKKKISTRHERVSMAGGKIQPKSFPSGLEEDLGMRGTIKAAWKAERCTDRSSPRQSPAGWSDRSPGAISPPQLPRMLVLSHFPACFVPSISPRKVDRIRTRSNSSPRETDLSSRASTRVPRANTCRRDDR